MCQLNANATEQNIISFELFPDVEKINYIQLTKSTFFKLTDKNYKVEEL